MSRRKAIEEQQRLAEANPRDARVLQKLGELFQKSGDTASAAATFFRVAEGYARDGFFLKAVALAKQVLRLDPRLVSARELLAGTYASLCLRREAIAEFRAVLDHYQLIGSAGAVARVAEALAQLGDVPGDRH